MKNNNNCHYNAWTKDTSRCDRGGDCRQNADDAHGRAKRKSHASCGGVGGQPGCARGVNITVNNRMFE